MTDQEKCALKKMIVQAIEKVTQDIAVLEEVTKPADTEDMDEISRMDAIITKSVNDAALVTSKNRLVQLEYALKKLDDPEYGYCQECGEKIPFQRLMAMPETIFCVHCAK